MDCKITMFKVDKQVLFRAEISSLSNFQKICLYFCESRFSFYGKKPSWEFMKKIISKITLVFAFKKNMK